MPQPQIHLIYYRSQECQEYLCNYLPNFRTLSKRNMEKKGNTTCRKYSKPQHFQHVDWILLRRTRQDMPLKSLAKSLQQPQWSGRFKDYNPRPKNPKSLNITVTLTITSYNNSLSSSINNAFLLLSTNTCNLQVRGLPFFGKVWNYQKTRNTSSLFNDEVSQNLRDYHRLGLRVGGKCSSQPVLTKGEGNQLGK